MVWTCSSEFFGYVYNEIEKENTMNIQIFGTKKCNYTKKLEKVLENPQVIKTPVVRNGKQSTLGYQPDIWKDWK